MDDVRVSAPSGSKPWRVRWRDRRGKWHERRAGSEKEAQRIAQQLRVGTVPRAQRRRPKRTLRLEHGTTISQPASDQGKYRIRYRDTSGERRERVVHTEAEALVLAKEIESYLASGQSVSEGSRTVTELAIAYLASIESMSQGYQDRQEGLLRRWVLPALGDIELVRWTAAQSEVLLDNARASVSPARVQDLGAVLRQLVTCAHKRSWLPRHADPMWRVRYSAPATRAENRHFVDRDDLPTVEQVDALVDAFRQRSPMWAIAIALRGCRSPGHPCGSGGV